MKVLDLFTSGGYSLLDDDDHRAWSGYKWGCHQGYICADFRMGDRKIRRFFLHRLIVKPVRGQQVHHKNKCRWDNRRENLECLSVEEHARRHPESRRLATLVLERKKAEMLWVHEQELLERVRFAEAHVRR